MANKAFSDFDFDLLDRYIGVVLDRYRESKRDRLEAIGDIAHLVALILRDEGGDPKAYMQAVVQYED
jgi:hypothetical protein